MQVHKSVHEKKRKLLEEGRGITLAKALEIAENCEKVDSQLAAMSLGGKREDSATANRIYTGLFSKNDETTHDTRKNRANTYYRCGNAGHLGRDPGCPTRGQSCHTCGLEGHFLTQCRTKRKADGKRGTRTHRNPSKGTANTVNLAEEGEEEPEYAFAVGTERQERIEVTVGGCKLNMMILVPVQISWTSKHGNG